MSDSLIASAPTPDDVNGIPERRTLQPAFAVVEKPLPVIQRLYNKAWLRKLLILIVLAAIWEIYGRYLHNKLLFPTFTQTIDALIYNIANGVLPARAGSSINVLLIGYACGIAVAALLTIIAISSRIGTDLLETLTSMFNPLPAIALLPLALIWFGLGKGSLVFVLVHSVTWQSRSIPMPAFWESAAR